MKVAAAMAKVRVGTYAEYAWPPFMGTLDKRNGLTVSLALAGGLALLLMLDLMLGGQLFNTRLVGKFYAISPHSALASISVRLGGVPRLARHGCDGVATRSPSGRGDGAVCNTLPCGSSRTASSASAALLKSAIEKRQKRGVQVGLE